MVRRSAVERLYLLVAGNQDGVANRINGVLEHAILRSSVVHWKMIYSLRAATASDKRLEIRIVSVRAVDCRKLAAQFSFIPCQMVHKFVVEMVGWILQCT